LTYYALPTKILDEVMSMAVTTKRIRSRVKRQDLLKRANKAGGEILALRKRYGLSQALLARLLDVSLRTVSGLESGTVAPIRRNLTQVARLCGALGEAMQADFVSRWLDEPNEMLAGLKPVEAIERGQLDLVWQVIEGLRSGSPL
jgi:transcriptional regulator with XRE-family HTH domain